jgi:hypothetical protein
VTTLTRRPSSATRRRRLLAGLLIGLATGLLAGRPALATPAISRIEPPGAPRGSEIEVVFRGRDLANPRELFFEDGRIEVTKLEGVDGGTVKATLRLPSDCPTGRHRLRIRTAEGLSELRSFRVGIFPQQAEQEPNNDFESAEVVELPRTISGVIKGEDVDCFKVRLPAGGRIAAAVDAIRLEQQFFDPYLELVDARGFVVAYCDDHPLLGQDPLLVATVAEAGDYVIRLRESAFGGNDNCVYLLHLADFPAAHVAWPPAGPPGGELEVEWLGDPGGPFRQPITLPAAAGPEGLAEIHPVRDGRVSPVPVPIRLSTLSTVTEAEPNDDPGKATPASAPVAVQGRLEAANDVDWFRVTAPQGTKWHVRGWGRRLGSPIDLVLNAHRDDDKRERITGNDDAEGPDSVLQLTVPAEGSFLIRVNDHQKRGGPEFVYWLEVEEATPEVHVSAPAARPNTQERLVAVVPRGNRSATLFNTARADFSGPVRVALEGLPNGVMATLPDAAGNARASLAVLEAAAEAEPTIALAGVQVAAAEDGRSLGGLRQKTDLVFGPGNAAYRVARADRLPVAVVEEAPIRIEVEQPAVPIVRRGSLELRVTVERLGGFEGKVRLLFPFRPPGIGTAASVEIPADRTEGVYLLNANPDAPLGEWQVAVTALAQPTENSRGDGEMLVSSRLVTLQVAEPVVELTAEPIGVEQGQKTTIVWKVQKPGEFSGTAKARLLGLPAKAEAPDVEFSADAREVVFPVAAADVAPVGQHKNVFCEFRVPQGEAWIVHASPPTTLRIDKPLPPEEEPRPTEESKP